MKSLSQHINEAFESNILTILANNTPKTIKNELFSNGLDWSVIPDDKLEQFDTKAAKRLAFSEEGALNTSTILWVKGQSIIGLSYGKWIRVQERDLYAGRRYNSSKPKYSSITAIAKDADFAYVITLDNSVEYAKFAADKRNSRWATRKDTLAFKSHEKVRDENMERYNALLAKAKLNKNENITKLKKIVADVFDEYSNIFNDLQGSPDWLQVKYVGERIASLTKAYSELLYIERDAEKGSVYDHQLRTVNTKLAEVQSTLKKIRENQEKIQSGSK